MSVGVYTIDSRIWSVSREEFYRKVHDGQVSFGNEPMTAYKATNIDTKLGTITCQAASNTPPGMLTVVSDPTVPDNYGFLFTQDIDRVYLTFDDGKWKAVRKSKYEEGHNEWGEICP